MVYEKIPNTQTKMNINITAKHQHVTIVTVSILHAL